MAPGAAGPSGGSGATGGEHGHGSRRGRVRVRRTGGVTGVPVESAVDLDSDDERAAPLRELVGRLDLTGVAPSETGADRFVYEFDVDGETHHVQEQDLTDELRTVADLVLRPGDAPRT